MILARVADSLYWMNRYLERVEHIARLLGLQLEHLPSSRSRRSPMVGDGSSAVLMRVPPVRISTAARRTRDDFFFADGYTLTDYLTFDTTNPTSIVFCLTAARENALSGTRRHQQRDLVEPQPRLPALTRHQLGGYLVQGTRYAVPRYRRDGPTLRRRVREFHAPGRRLALYAHRSIYRAGPTRRFPP